MAVQGQRVLHSCARGMPGAVAYQCGLTDAPPAADTPEWLFPGHGRFNVSFVRMVANTAYPWHTL